MLWDGKDFKAHLIPTIPCAWAIIPHQHFKEFFLIIETQEELLVRDVQRSFSPTQQALPNSREI